MILSGSSRNAFLNPVSPVSTTPFGRLAPQVNPYYASQIQQSGVGFQYNPTLPVAGRFGATPGGGTIQYRNLPGLSGIVAHEGIHALQQVGPRGNLLQEIVGAVPRTIGGRATPLQRVVALGQSAVASLLPGVGGLAGGASFLNEYLAYGAGGSNNLLRRAMLGLVYPNYLTGPEPNVALPAAQDRHTTPRGFQPVNVRAVLAPIIKKAMTPARTPRQMRTPAVGRGGFAV